MFQRQDFDSEDALVEVCVKSQRKAPDQDLVFEEVCQEVKRLEESVEGGIQSLNKVRRCAVL